MKAEDIWLECLETREDDNSAPIARALTLAQQEARAERDREWQAAAGIAGVVRTREGGLFIMDGGDVSALRALLEGK